MRGRVNGDRQIEEWKRRNQDAIRRLRGALDSADCLGELAAYERGFLMLYPGAVDAIQRVEHGDERAAVDGEFERAA